MTQDGERLVEVLTVLMMAAAMLLAPGRQHSNEPFALNKGADGHTTIKNERQSSPISELPFEINSPMLAASDDKIAKRLGLLQLDELLFRPDNSMAGAVEKPRSC